MWMAGKIFAISLKQIPYQSDDDGDDASKDAVVARVTSDMAL